MITDPVKQAKARMLYAMYMQNENYSWSQIKEAKNTEATAQ